MLLHRGQFSQYINDSASRNVLDESLNRSRTFSESSIHSGSGTTIFVSHKHSDLDNVELRDVLQFLTQKYGIIPYIDCMDPNMPPQTSAETANRIKAVIGACQRFILLATEDALKSMWCNWEVGIADKTKYSLDSMAILPLLERNQNENDYIGNEYLRLYPYIIKEISVPGRCRYYVQIPRTGRKVLLSEWINPTNQIYG